MGFMGLNLFNSLENNDFVMVATGTNLFSNEITKIFLNKIELVLVVKGRSVGYFHISAFIHKPP